MGHGSRQRSETEWKFGRVQPPQNAFVSGQPKKITCELADMPGQQGISRHGWVVPMQRKNRVKVVTVHRPSQWREGLPFSMVSRAAGRGNQGGTTGA